MLHGAVSGMRPFLQKTRGWTDRSGPRPSRTCAAHGLITVADDGSVELTDAGRAVKGDSNVSTRLAALAGWRHLGLDGTQRLIDCLTPVGAPCWPATSSRPARRCDSSPRDVDQSRSVSG